MKLTGPDYAIDRLGFKWSWSRDNAAHCFQFIPEPQPDCRAWWQFNPDEQSEHVFATETLETGYAFHLKTHVPDFVGTRTVVVRTREEANAARVLRPDRSYKNELLSVAINRPEAFTDEQAFGFMRLAGILEDREEVRKVMRYSARWHPRLCEMLEELK